MVCQDVTSQWQVRSNLVKGVVAHGNDQWKKRNQFRRQVRVEVVVCYNSKPVICPDKYPRLEETTPPNDSQYHGLNNSQDHTVIPSQDHTVTTSQDHTVTPSKHSQSNGNFKTPSRRGLTSATHSTHMDSTLTGSHSHTHTPSDSTNYFKYRQDSSNKDDSYAKMATTVSQSPYQTQTESHTLSQSQSSSKYRRLYALSRAPAGPYITVTGSDRTRVYLRLKRDQRSNRNDLFVSSQLLSVPITQLREQVEEEVCVCSNSF